MAIKSHLDEQIRKLLINRPRDEYILLDRGDGAAVCFLLEPETALYFALDLREAVRAQGDSTVPYEIRTGIHMGPIKIIFDVKGEKTTLGEGINSAARIMDFAGPGQILVSRSFYEVVCCLGQEYAELFSYCGKRADKHVREFEVYEIALAVHHVPSPVDLGTADRENPARPDWEPEALNSRIARLTDEWGPMARVLVQQAAQQAETLEELDRMLAEADHPLTLAPSPGAGVPVPFDGALVRRAERLLCGTLGPIGTLLVKNAVERALDERSFRQMLADELDTESERHQFLTQLDNEY
ncbi:hypothetical protein [Marinobacter sp. F4216]|uniref:hypothetical protein n=1 Tax=Marinobacter sp. F4216 TaxID=2874281 RepID=UPI001CC0A65A|nr:hypothetical protein [Marinobacter sp. F4216]MBZ2168626.1 hypothetical protein [Marinobacter sp. F4216]